MSIITLIIIFSLQIVLLYFEKTFYYLALLEIKQVKEKIHYPKVKYHYWQALFLFAFNDLLFYIIFKNTPLEIKDLILILSASILVIMGSFDWKIRLVLDKFIILLAITNVLFVLSQIETQYLFLFSTMFSYYLALAFYEEDFYKQFSKITQKFGFADIKVLWAIFPTSIPFFISNTHFIKSGTEILSLDFLLFLIITIGLAIGYMLKTNKNAPLITAASLSFPITFLIQ